MKNSGSSEPGSRRSGEAIGAVERDTGLSKDTLRVWERRYGFPRPERDAFGERLYSVEDVAKLRVIKRLIDQGHRPGKIVELPVGDLQRLTESRPTARRKRQGGDALSMQTEPHPDLAPYIELMKAHRIDDLRRELVQAVMRLGLGHFVTSIVAPLNHRVGDAWARGYFEVFEEHLYTESVQVVLRNAINGVPTTRRRPRVLLTTFPQEPHGIGILMAEAILALEGCACVSLGTQTPVRDIVLAANAQQSDIVALSFSACLAPNPVLDGLAELRTRLPPATEIWAGGTSQVLYRRPPKDVHTFKTLETIAPALARWRAAHGPV
jgi:DNA-binding transcriptional MerR regulator/methylmalonyl-CoA mutase cobalamin-binding subunit